VSEGFHRAASRRGSEVEGKGPREEVTVQDKILVEETGITGQRRGMDNAQIGSS